MKTLIQTLTDDAGEEGFDIYFGYGILNLTKAELAITHAAPPIITVQPQNTEIMQGTTYTLSVTAQSTDGGSLGYQWYVNSGSTWTAISGATSPTYSVPADMVGTYNFYVLVTNTNNSAYGIKTASVESNTVTLAVKAVPIEPTGRLTVKAPVFDEVAYLYTRPDALALSIVNIGNGASAISSVTISENKAFDVISGDAEVLSGGSNNSWKIQPKAALAAGLYTAIVTIAYDRGMSAAIAVSFTVNKAKPTVTATPVSSNVSAGNKLSTSTLSGGIASTEGTFEWSAPDTVVSASGAYDAVFTPVDTSNYEAVVLQVPVTVNAVGGFSSTSGSNGGGSSGGGGSNGGGGNNGGGNNGGGSSGGNGDTTYYTVTFDTNGGNAIQSQRLAYNGKAAKPDDPQRESFVFVGWYSDKELTKEFDFDTLISSNTTLYAKWTGNAEGAISVLSERQNLFIDVQRSDWFYSDVEYVCANGLFSGTSAITFNPNAPLTRAMLVTVLWRLAGSPVTSGGNSFIDVGSGLWYSDAVAWAAVNAIVSGIGGGMFAPDAEITRQDMAAMLMRYLNVSKLDYVITTEYRFFADDTEIADYAKNAVQVLNKLNIINGKGNNIIDPKGTATRGEAAAMLHRIMEL